jgi:chlorophyllide a reductase subunit Z
MDKVDATPAREGEWNAAPWDEDALSLLDEKVQNEPFIVRISAAKRLRDRVEADARAAREGRISLGRVRESLEAMHA